MAISQELLNKIYEGQNVTGQKIDTPVGNEKMEQIQTNYSTGQLPNFSIQGGKGLLSILDNAIKTLVEKNKKHYNNSNREYYYNKRLYDDYKNFYYDRDYSYFRNLINTYGSKTYQSNYPTAFKDILTGIVEMNYRNMGTAESPRIIYEEKREPEVGRRIGVAQGKAPKFKGDRPRKRRTKETVIE